MADIIIWRDLKVWQKAHELTLATYQITHHFPADEKFGLIAQMRRAAASVPANIVEGFHRKTVKDSIHFYNNASSSLEELRYQFLLAHDLHYINQATYQHAEKHAEEVSKMLNAWSRSQQQNVARTSQ